MPSLTNSVQEFKKLKDEPLKTKVEYIFTYYWIPILAFVILIAILISQIIHFSNAKETILSGHCINATGDSSGAAQFVATFAESSGIDTASSEISIVTSQFSPGASYDSYVANQLITAKIAAKSLDFITADFENLLPYAYQEAFIDLRAIMSKEQMQTMSAYFLYMDLAVIEKLETTNDQPPVYPDPTAPENMSHPIPFAVVIPANSEFAKLYYPHRDDAIALAVVSTAPNPTLTVSFVDYICNKWS